MIGTVILGICAASIEYAFALSLQDFFQHLGLFRTPQTLFQTPNFEVSVFFLLAIALIRAISEGLKIYLSRLCQQKFAQFTRFNIIRTALEDAANQSSSRTLSLFSEETNRASNSILNLATVLTHMALSLGLFTLCMFNFPAATFVGILCLGSLAIPYRIFDRKMARTGIHLSEEWEKTNMILVEGIRNNFYLKVIGKIEEEKLRANTFLTNYLSLFKRVFFQISFKTSAPSFLGVLILVSIAYFQHKYTSFGPKFRLLEFFYLFLRFTQATATTGTLLSDFKINVESSKRIKEWYLNTQELRKPHGQIKVPIIDPIEFKISDLTFSYDHHHLFKNLNLNLVPGDVLTITGESGVGKSTLLALMLGLIKPTGGQILLNNKEVFEIQPSMTSFVSYVGPHPFITEGSIWDNLKYGSSDRSFTEEEAYKALESACLRDFVEKLPLKLQTPVNEMGSKMSTGQKQRLMIARALLRKPKLLIMDEATANLDPLTEKELINNLQEYLSHIITVIVTHKDVFNSISTKALPLKK